MGERPGECEKKRNAQRILWTPPTGCKFPLAMQTQNQPPFICLTAAVGRVQRVVIGLAIVKIYCPVTNRTTNEPTNQPANQPNSQSTNQTVNSSCICPTVCACVCVAVASCELQVGNMHTHFMRCSRSGEKRGLGGRCNENGAILMEIFIESQQSAQWPS